MENKFYSGHVGLISDLKSGKIEKVTAEERYIVWDPVPNADWYSLTEWAGDERRGFTVYTSRFRITNTRSLV